MARSAFHTLINDRITAVASTLPRNDTVFPTSQLSLPLNFSIFQQSYFASVDTIAISSIMSSNVQVVKFV